LPKGFGEKLITGAGLPLTVSSTVGVDWNPLAPLDVPFTKLGGATESNIHVRLNWTVYMLTAGYFNAFAGVKLSGTSYWSAIQHGNNQADHRFEHADMLILTGLSAGLKTLRAVIKKGDAGSQSLRLDGNDHFRIEYEEVPI
jgi:hypothetical protein